MAWAMLFAASALAAETPSVIEIPQKRIESADFRASGHLVRVGGNGNRISFPIAIKAHWFPGVLKVLVEIGSASKGSTNSSVSDHIPVHILLEMHRNGQNLIQIAHSGDKTPTILPFDRWGDGPVNSGFSYEDFLEPQYFWPGQTVLESTRRGSRDCDILKSTPGAGDKTHYAEVRSWLDRTIGFPVYVEKTTRATATVKEFTYFGLRQNGGLWSASQVEVKVRGQTGSTLLVIDRGSPKANLGAKDFNPAQISQF
jgi:hypothetical protein